MYAQIPLSASKIPDGWIPFLSIHLISLQLKPCGSGKKLEPTYSDLAYQSRFLIPFAAPLSAFERSKPEQGRTLGPPVYPIHKVSKVLSSFLRPQVSTRTHSPTRPHRFIPFKVITFGRRLLANATELNEVVATLCHQCIRARAHIHVGFSTRIEVEMGGCGCDLE